MADFPNNGVLHDDPDLTAAARAHRGTKRNARKRRARAAKAERKANDPAFAAAEEAASKAKIENNLRKKKIEEAKMAKYGRGFWLTDLRQANRWLYYQLAQPGRSGLSKPDCISFRAHFNKKHTLFPLGGKALERYWQERKEAMKKLAPGEKLLDWWKDEAKETKAAKSGGVVALPVSREEGVVIGGEGEEMEEGEAEVEGEEEFLGGLGAWRGRTTLALRLKDGQAMEMGVEQEQNGEDDGDDDDEGEAVDDKRLVDEDA